MAKNFGKFLLGVAAIGTAAAAAYLYVQKKASVCDTQEENDTDYDDFSDEQEEAVPRNYVQLNKECTCDTEETTCEECTCEETACEEAPAEENIYTEAAPEEAPAEETPAEPEKVEEFFNEENA